MIKLTWNELQQLPTSELETLLEAMIAALQAAEPGSLAEVDAREAMAEIRGELARRRLGVRAKPRLPSP